MRQGFEPWVELLGPYNGLTNRRLQPLGHLTADAKCTRNQHLRKRFNSSGDGFWDRDLREFGQNHQ